MNLNLVSIEIQEVTQSKQHIMHASIRSATAVSKYSCSYHVNLRDAVQTLHLNVHSDRDGRAWQEKRKHTLACSVLWRNNAHLYVQPLTSRTQQSPAEPSRTQADI